MRRSTLLSPPRLWLAALVLALAAPALAAGPASAAPPHCNGRDLSNNPDVKPDLVAHADELLNGEGLLWRVEKPGLAPSYLYGTIHSTNAAAVALAKEALAYLDGAKVVATELGGPMDAAEKVDLGSGMLRAALSPQQDTLAGAMSAEDIERRRCVSERARLSPGDVASPRALVPRGGRFAPDLRSGGRARGPAGGR